ncbi:hypothetical protein D3C87_1743380 [compost metagenome]
MMTPDEPVPHLAKEYLICRSFALTLQVDCKYTVESSSSVPDTLPGRNSRFYPKEENMATSNFRYANQVLKNMLQCQDLDF